MAEVTKIIFDGTVVRLCDSNGSLVAHCLAISGKSGYQAPSLQNLVEIGPIPEGKYTLRPEDIDYRDDPLEMIA